LTLTAADTVIHYDPWWNPAVEAQATDRAHRIGQERPVNAYKLVTTGTVEEKILALQRKKRDVIEAALDDEAPLMQGLSTDELRDVIG
jgi:SNF2 family DNA or RNA helicase